MIRIQIQLLGVGAVLLLLWSCASSNKKAEHAQTEQLIDVVFQLDCDSTYQTIHNFGASDAWATQYVGANWPIVKREQIADLLFSLETKDDGSPAGIGLSAWRFNIGAGSAQQGDASGITDAWRRAECFLQADGRYDWSRQSGQQWFLKAAKERGVNEFIAFVNSPPVSMTSNGKAWSDDGLAANLNLHRYQDYAQFLVQTLQGLSQTSGVQFDYISPFNEPQWEWKCCGQEGTPWNNDEIAAMTHVLDREIRKASLDTKIELTESGQIDYLYDNKNNSLRGNQVEEFFSPSSPNYVEGLSTVGKKIAGHSYFSTWDSSVLIGKRESLRQTMQDIDPQLEYWMSEYCILEDNEQIKGSGRDLGMDAALYIAKVIYADLVVAQASAWHWWLAISPYDYKDGLVYIDDDKQDGEVYESKMLWTLGHYSRFVRPGSVRVKVTRWDDKNIQNSLDELLVSAFRSEDKKQVTLVLSNSLDQPQVVRIEGIPKNLKKVSIYRTSSLDHENLSLIKTKDVYGTITLPARSIVTCVMN
ncbi:O-Glycosyl hydrolase [Reichenbachiella agariperforans]|uniref:O-Glycosyl hydrolase n=1 Tax=Reichenbachiella agariperforans TaxID=156994 RepID=A0A1M6SRW5_REIAG|nr:glycoside hydrolase [Reichenbachiella agariperforans]SHK47338.1 O-Glycosyl hydrolase [Reichenbachiella agariperforans]